MLTRSGLEDWSGKLHTTEFSVGWVLKIRRRHLHRTVQRLRNISEWITLKAGIYREMCCSSGGHENSNSVCLARIFPSSHCTFCPALLPYFPFNLFVFKVNPQSLPSPPLTRFCPLLSLKWNHLCVFLILTKCVIHSFMFPHLTITQTST